MSRIILGFSFLLLSFCAKAQDDTTRLFAFGHSLVNHATSDETTIPHWIFKLAEEAGLPFAAGGKYGFLPQHRILPPFSQWGYTEVPPVWESDSETFAEAEINTILITAGNFIQYQPPTEEYEGIEPAMTPISATTEIIEWTLMQEDSMDVFIYENWPDMAGFLNNGFPADSAEFAAYHQYTLGAFHDWWLEYHDSLRSAFEGEQIRMIPVGPILADLLSNTSLRTIPVSDLYEDDAPHGHPTIYFLAGLITYMAIFEEPAPKTYIPPNSIHSVVRDGYEMIVDFAWTELTNFQDLNGQSRVFKQNLTTNLDFDLESDGISLYPNPNEGIFNISGNLSDYVLEIVNVSGQVIRVLDPGDNNITIDISDLPDGTYFMRATKTGNTHLFFQKVLKF